MAKSFIHYQTIKGKQYASIYTPKRTNGKKDNQPKYLGKVINKEQGIYQNTKQGTFKYTLKDGYTTPQQQQPQNQTTTPPTKENLNLSFGDTYTLHQILQKNDYWNLLQNILPNHADTLCSLLFYHLLRKGPNCYAHDWWTSSYTRILCPNAKLQSQRISEFLTLLGNEHIQRNFFKKYLAKISTDQKKHGILLDSTGMQNDIEFPLTAPNTHHGTTKNETRLILVIDRLTNLPLLYRYNAGNIVDVSTLKTTLLELGAYGVWIDFSIIDAGYCSQKNLQALYDQNIGFITRLKTNLKLYKELIAAYGAGLESLGNAVFYRDRLLYIKCVPTVVCGHEAYAYVALDHQRRSEEVYEFMRDALEEDDLSVQELDQRTLGLGVFVLLSSVRVDVSEILPLYYTRQMVEQVFDLYKNNVDLLPLRTHGEDTFRGHLMLSFLGVIVYMLVNGLLGGSRFCAEGAFRSLVNLRCSVFDDCILVKEATKKNNEIAEHLKIEFPLKL